MVTEARTIRALLLGVVCMLIPSACHGQNRDNSNVAPAPPAARPPGPPISTVQATETEKPAKAAPAMARPRTPPPLEPVALDSQGRDIVKRLASIKSYAGSVVERGVLPGGATIESSILFRAPSSFRTVVTSPTQMKGVAVSYVNNTLVYVFPQLRYGIRIRNLHLPDAQQARVLMGRSYKQSQKLYAYRFGTSKRVAGLPTVTLHHFARQKTNIQRSGYHRVYLKYALPLAGEVKLRDGSRYRYEYKTLRFGASVSDSELSVSPSPKFLISNWDLDSRDFPLAEAKKAGGFELSFPDSLGRQRLSRMRIVRVAGPVPAFTAVYRRGPLTVLATAFATTTPLPEYGIPVKTDKISGRLLMTPILSSLSFIHGKTTYVLLGNVRFEDLLAIADSVAE